VLGLEQGSLPRRAQASPFLDDQARTEIDLRKRGARLTRPEQVSRERYLFYTACTRASRRVYLVREAATDDGSPREAGPFWDEVRSLWPADDVERWTTRRRLSSLTWPLERAPTERERLRALAALSPSEPQTADAAARANGWERKLERARGAFERATRLRHPSVLDELRSRQTFSVTELEAFADCSSIWFLERVVSPRTIDSQADARLRGSIAHTALHKFFAGLPKALGVEQVGPEQLDDAIAFLHQCLDEALETGLWLELTDVERSELEQALRRDLEHFVRKDAELELSFVPRRFEVSFGSDRAAPELQAGLDLGGFALSGKIDRIDVDPFSARGIVQDYKSGKTAFSAAKIESELRLQIPLYMLVLRDLIGIEPLGGLYRALAGERDARGLLRAGAKEDLPGFVSTDYLDEDEFWRQVETGRERATALVERIRGGDVEHDPKGGFPCPSWCELWSMCRVRRA
jgi:ATP-dependent helicase/nuclease subunit B